MTRNLTAIIEKEGDGYVALCPELDIASQGDTVAESRSNLSEALALFFETASSEEVNERLHGEYIGIGNGRHCWMLTISSSSEELAMHGSIFSVA